MRLESTGNLKTLISEYYDDLKKCSKNGNPVVWVNVGAPSELFYAMDISLFILKTTGRCLEQEKKLRSIQK